MPLERLCYLSGVSRAGFLPLASVSRGDTDIDLRDEIQQIALEWPSYGWRRVKKELGRRGWVVNHKRVRRIMREDNLLCLRRRRFIVTTDSNHRLPATRISPARWRPQASINSGWPILRTFGWRPNLCTWL